MDIITLTLRLVLAFLLSLSGAAKLADRKGTETALKNFGIPAGIRSATSFALPITELTIAVLLIPTSTAWWSAVCAGFLFTVFTIAVATNLIAGRKPNCHCFGQLSSEPISGKTLVRNLMLLIGAGWLVWTGKNDMGVSFAVLAINLSGLELAAFISLILNAVLIFGLGWFSYQLWRQQGRMLLRLDAAEAASNQPATFTRNGKPGLLIGTKAPDFSLQDLSGNTVTLQNLLNEKPVLLLFMDPQCGPCNAMIPDVKRWQHDISEQMLIAIISRGTLSENAMKQNHDLSHVLLQQDREVLAAYRTGVTPSAVLIRQDGHIESDTVAGSEDIKTLIANLMRSNEESVSQRI